MKASPVIALSKPHLHIAQILFSKISVISHLFLKFLTKFRKSSSDGSINLNPPKKQSRGSLVTQPKEDKCGLLKSVPEEDTESTPRGIKMKIRKKAHTKVSKSHLLKANFSEIED